MEKTITDDYGRDVDVYTSLNGSVHVTINDGQVAMSNLNRGQLRSLIEALRQADAETRTEREIELRYDVHDGLPEVRAIGLRPGSVREYAQGNISGPVSEASARSWWDRVRENRGEFRNAQVITVGFPDEPTEG